MGVDGGGCILIQQLGQGSGDAGHGGNGLDLELQPPYSTRGTLTIEVTASPLVAQLCCTTTGINPESSNWSLGLEPPMIL